MQGDWLLVGAPGMDDGAPGTGAAFLYHRYEGGFNAWGLVKKLEPPALPAGSAFGSVVTLLDGQAIISAPAEPMNVLPTGAVHVFDRDEGGPDNWGHRQRIVPDTAQVGMEFGAAFATDGDRLIVHAPLYDEAPDDGMPEGVGALIGFQRDEDGAFNERRFLRGDSLVPECPFRPCAGVRAVLVGGVVLLPVREHLYYRDVMIFMEDAPGADHASTVPLTNDFGIPPEPFRFTGITASNGVVASCMRTGGFIYPRIISFATAPWPAAPVQEGVMRPDSMDYLDWWPEGGWGDAVDLHEDVLVVGAFGHPTLTPLGHAEVFVRDTGLPDHWRPLQRLAPAEAAPGDQFGRSVAVFADAIAVGAPGAGTGDRGRVHVFMDPTVLVPEQDSRSDISVFPNPANAGTDHVQLRGPMALSAHLAVINARDGAIVRTLPGLSGGSIPINGLAPGMYAILQMDVSPRGARSFAPFVILR